MATAQDNLTREAQETRDAFEDMKAAVATRLDALTKQVADLVAAQANPAAGDAADQTVADGLNTLQTDMRAFADQVRGASPTPGGVDIPADGGTTAPGNGVPATGTPGGTDTGTTTGDGTVTKVDPI